MPDLTSDNIRYLLTLPPEEIVRWYQSKGYRFSWNWQDTWQSAHTRVRTVAKVMKLDILQAIYENVDKIFTEGITEQQFRRNLEYQLRSLGWWGKMRADEVPGYDPNLGVEPDKIVQLGSPRRLKIIYQTNARVGYSAGRYNSFMQNTASRPYWQYKQLERKNRRIEHARYADKVFRFDDPIWDHIFPPNGFNCGCYIIALTKDEVASRGLKIWNGKDVDVEVAEGWDFNPAKDYASWKPDLSKYDDDIRNQY